jgi:hypothetical protein
MIFILVIMNMTFVGIAFGADQFYIEVLLKEVRNEFSDDIHYEPATYL